MTFTRAALFKIKIDEAKLRDNCSTLSESQMSFASLVQDWLENPRKLLAIVTGGPGTGKSHLVKKIFDCIEAPQLRMSYTARSAHSIGGRTIHSALRLDRREIEKLNEELKLETDLQRSIDRSRRVVSLFSRIWPRPLVVVVDDVSVIEGWLMHWLIRYFMDGSLSPVLIACLGDPRHLGPIKSSHNLFSASLFEKDYEVRQIHLIENMRHTPEYEKTLNLLRDLKNEFAAIAFVRENFPVVEWVDDCLLAYADRAVAHTNATVQEYNDFHVKHCVVGRKYWLPGGELLKTGCLVFVTKNNCSSVPNGTLLRFDRYDSDENVVVCKDPETGGDVKVREDGSTKRFPIELGFACTIHKFRGDAMRDARTVVNLDGRRDLDLIYTVLSQLREKEQLLAIKF